MNFGIGNQPGHFLVQQIVAFGQDFSGFGVSNPARQNPPINTLVKRLVGNVVTAVDPNSIGRTAILVIDDHILRYVHQPAGQVTRISRPQSGIGQAFARAMSRDEVFQSRKAFPEVGADWHWNDAAGGVGHQTAHASHLCNRAEAAFCGTRCRHR